MTHIYVCEWSKNIAAWLGQLEYTKKMYIIVSQATVILYFTVAAILFPFAMGITIVFLDFLVILK